MSSQETDLEHSRKPTGSKSTRIGFAEAEIKNGDASFQAQGEFFKTLQEMSREWMARTTAEVELALKLSQKLTAVHSVPDAITAYQEWFGELMGARTEEARRLMSNGQTLMDASSRLLSNGWMSAATTS
jgi:Phasin protein